MARVVLPRPLAEELFGGRETIEVPGKTLYGVVHALEALAPGFQVRAREDMAMAVDGMLAEDWATPVGPDSEILIVRRVAGGQARS